MSLLADNAGRLTGVFRVPGGIPVGTKSVTFKGTNSTAQAIYRAEGWKRVETWGRVETTVTSVAIGVDPLGQIVSLPYDCMVTGVDVWPMALGDRSKPIIAQWRGVEAGVPSQAIFAEKWLSGTALTTGGWLSFNFDLPILSRSDTLYAPVFLTEDANHALGVAKLGGFDNRPGRGWVTGQPYTGGSMVSSADALSWRVHPDMDMAIRVRAARFNQLNRTMRLGTFAAERVSDLMSFLVMLRPEGTEVEVEFVMPSGQRFIVTPESACELAEYVTGDITVNVTLRGTERMSPILRPDAQIVQGTIAEEADYVSRFMGAGMGSLQKLVTDANLVGSSSFKAYTQTGGTVDDPVWSEMQLKQATPLGDGLVEHELSQPVDLPESRFKIALKGGPAARLSLSALRGVTTPNI